MENISYGSLVTDIFYASLKSVDSYESVKLYTGRIRSIYQEGNYSRFIIIGFGKASWLMSKAMEYELGNLISEGIVITKYGHSISQGSMIIIIAEVMGLNPEEYMNNNDSYNFFKKIDGLFITGPTGTNVMDIQVIVIG